MAKHNKNKIINKITPFQMPVVIPEPQDESMLVWEKLIIGFSFLCVFLLYLYTLAPSVPSGDSGELITSACILGVPHPPGYPLFNILGKLFSLIPVGSIAWRINLMSAVFDLLAAIFIYLTVFKLTRDWPAAILGALFFAVSPIVWEYSLKAEVFALNNFFAALIVYLLVVLRWHFHVPPTQDKTKTNTIYLLLLTCGLAVTNHHTIILFAPAVMVCLFAYGRDSLVDPIVALKAISAFVAGLLVYLYIPIRAHVQPYINRDDPRTWDGFIQLITRADFGSLRLMYVDGEPYNLIEKWGIYLASLISEFNPLGVLLALIGLIFLVRHQDKILGRVLLGTYLLSGFVFFMMADLSKSEPIYQGIYERFYMLSEILVAIFIGLGVYCIHKKISNRSACNWVNGVAVIALIIKVMINFPHVSQRDVNVEYDFGRNLLSSFDKNAVVLVSGDTTINSILYLQQVEGVRPDVVVLNQILLSHTWYCRQMQARYPGLIIPFVRADAREKIIGLIDANINKRSVYATDDRFFDSPYRVIPMGLARKLVKKGYFPDIDKLIQVNDALWKQYNLDGLNRVYSVKSYEKTIVRYYAAAHFYLGWEYHQLGMFDMALGEYDKAIQIDEAVPPAYKNAGFIYYDVKNQPEQAARYFRVYLTLEPEDKDSARIRRLIGPR